MKSSWPTLLLFPAEMAVPAVGSIHLAGRTPGTLGRTSGYGWRAFPCRATKFRPHTELMNTVNVLSTPAKPPPVPIPAVILLVDDEPTLQSILGRLLSMHGFDVHFASTVAESIGIAEAVQVDGAIIDLSLRDNGSGLEVLTSLRSRSRYVDLPVLILTGHTHVDQATGDLIRRSRAHLFHKPQPFAPLVAHLRSLMTRATPPPCDERFEAQDAGRKSRVAAF